MIETEIGNLAWNTFKQTGNINTFVEMKQLESIKGKQLDNLSNNQIQNMEQKL